ncbi:pentapeptide repeat-containing protein [Streptomyces sp. NPDC101234]|uniref:pentapeptide repeat-containing protein n=1 Tax=Streptomyces sp. NPDC101234 TaxID=3366138 RepID=UPI00382B8924
MDKKSVSRVPLWAWWLLVTLGGVAAAGAALWRVPWWIDHQYLNSKLSPAVATAVTGVRTAMVALGAGGLAVIGILYTHRTWHQAREGQVTDRYTKAIGQIASDKPVEQLGGIYALERIMRDSPKDHATIVEVLAAFVREHAPTPNKPSAYELGVRLARRLLRAGVSVMTPEHGRSRGRIVVLPRPSEPVQAALTVLGRRPRNRDEPFQLQLNITDLRGAKLVDAHFEGANLIGNHLERANLIGAHLERADLIGAHLMGARLNGAHLEGARLIGAHLEGADLDGTHLERADLDGTHLERADLIGAHLMGARLNGAHLEGARLIGAHLEGADLDGTHLEGADLDRAHLESARHLTVGQLVTARPWQSTRLPAELAADAAVRARIAETEKRGRYRPVSGRGTRHQKPRRVDGGRQPRG